MIQRVYPFILYYDLILPKVAFHVEINFGSYTNQQQGSRFRKKEADFKLRYLVYIQANPLKGGIPREYASNR